jgi:hypothetical protein
MSHPGLNGSGIVAGVGQRIAAAVPQHVRVNREGHTGALTEARDQCVKALRRDRAATCRMACSISAALVLARVRPLTSFWNSSSRIEIG